MAAGDLPVPESPCDQPGLMPWERIALGCGPEPGEIDLCEGLDLADRLRLGCVAIEDAAPLRPRPFRPSIPLVSDAELLPPRWTSDCCRLPLPEANCRRSSVRECGPRPCLEDVIANAGHVTPAQAADAYRFTAPGVLVSVQPWEEEILQDAMALLQNFIDVVDWYCCMYSGPDSPTCDCIRDLVMGTGDSQLHFKKKKRGKCSDPDTAMHVVPGTNVVFVCAGYLQKVRDGHFSITDVAETIVHELAHACEMPGETSHFDVGSFVDLPGIEICDPVQAFGGDIFAVLDAVEKGRCTSSLDFLPGNRPPLWP